MPTAGTYYVEGNVDHRQDLRLDQPAVSVIATGNINVTERQRRS